jgi:hypothetical protein
MGCEGDFAPQGLQAAGRLTLSPYLFEGSRFVQILATHKYVPMDASLPDGALASGPSRKNCFKK